jgi:hypothetical protein
VRSTVFLLFVLVALVSPSIRAQNLPDRESARPTINLTAEQRHVIKENVLTSPGLKKEAPDIQVSVGEPAPAGVSVQPFPPMVLDKIPQAKSHRFFVKGDSVVIVNPNDNTVADVIE